MSGTKVTLSDAELSMFTDAGIILTKNHILQQTKGLLEALQEQMTLSVSRQWPGQPLFDISPKVSRGENYLGLPWLVLDYPRNFGTKDVFAIRSFFWWGNFYSSTLHLSGNYSEQMRNRIAAAYETFASRQYYLHTGTDPWAHHFGPDNYTPVAHLDAAQFTRLLHRQAPIKIAAKWPLQQWQFAASHLYESWELLLRVCLD